VCIVRCKISPATIIVYSNITRLSFFAVDNVLRAVSSFNRCSLAFFNLSNMLVVGQYRHTARRKKVFTKAHVSVELPNGYRNGRTLGIARWEKMGMRFKCKMGMEVGWERSQ